MTFVRPGCEKKTVWLDVSTYITAGDVRFHVCSVLLFKATLPNFSFFSVLSPCDMLTGAVQTDDVRQLGENPTLPARLFSVFGWGGEQEKT